MGEILINNSVQTVMELIYFDKFISGDSSKSMDAFSNYINKKCILRLK